MHARQSAEVNGNEIQASTQTYSSEVVMPQHKTDAKAYSFL